MDSMCPSSLQALQVLFGILSAALLHPSFLRLPPRLFLLSLHPPHPSTSGLLSQLQQTHSLPPEAFAHAVPTVRQL